MPSLVPNSEQQKEVVITKNRSTAAAKFWSWHWECCSWPSWRTQRQWLTSLKQSKGRLQAVEIGKLGAQRIERSPRKRHTQHHVYIHVHHKIADCLSDINRLMIYQIIFLIFLKDRNRISVELVEPKTCQPDGWQIPKCTKITQWYHLPLKVSTNLWFKSVLS